MRRRRNLVREKSNRLRTLRAETACHSIWTIAQLVDGGPDSITRLLRDHPLADTLARAGHDLVYDRFCVEQMVRSIETIYDEAIAEERRIAG